MAVMTCKEVMEEGVIGPQAGMTTMKIKEGILPTEGMTLEEEVHGFFFISWAGSHMRDDCYVGCTHCSLQDNLESTVCSMFTVPNMFGA